MTSGQNEIVVYTEVAMGWKRLPTLGEGWGTWARKDFPDRVVFELNSEGQVRFQQVEFE